MIWFKRKKDKEDFEGVDYTMLDNGNETATLLMKLSRDIEDKELIRIYFEEFKLNLKAQYGIQ